MTETPRFVSSRSFGPTLESERLPVLGDNRQAERARALRRVLIALGLFWAIVAFALLGKVF